MVRKAKLKDLTLVRVEISLDGKRPPNSILYDVYLTYCDKKGQQTQKYVCLYGKDLLKEIKGEFEKYGAKT